MTNKKKLVIISSVAAAMIILLITLLCSCKGNTENTSTADEIIGTSVQTVTEIVTDAQGSTQIQEVTEVVNVKADGTVEKSEDVTKPTEKEINDDNKKLVAENGSSSSKTTSDNSSNNNTSSNSSPKVENQNSKPTANTNSNSNSSSSSATSKPSGGNIAPTTSSATSKVWHEAVYEYIEHPAVTEQVWVVDKEAYTYEEPVYEYKYRTLCNDCNEDITEDPGFHCANEALNGGKGSYRNERVKFQTGTETITVPEQGHYETRIVKEAYTEKKLVKEAGYY